MCVWVVVCCRLAGNRGAKARVDEHPELEFQRKSCQPTHHAFPPRPLWPLLFRLEPGVVGSWGEAAECESDASAESRRSDGSPSDLFADGPCRRRVGESSEGAADVVAW